MMEQVNYSAIGRKVIDGDPTVLHSLESLTVREVLEAALTCDDRAVETGLGFCVVYAMTLGDDRPANNPYLSRIGRYLLAAVNAVTEVD